MNKHSWASAITAIIVLLSAWAGYAHAADKATVKSEEVTLKGSLVCNGACVVKPKDEDHVMVLFAIDGTAEIRAEVDKIMKEFYPDEGLDVDAAEKVMDQFSARL